MNGECNNLDAYLADDVRVEQAAQFERHLQQCDACREAIDEQRWIDDLLKSPIRLQLEPVPVELVELTRTPVSRRRRHVQLAACGLTAAATLLVAVGWLELNRQAVGRMDRSASVQAVVDRIARGTAAPRATFVGNSDVIAMPIESHHADVTIVRIYPTYRPRYDSQTAAAKPNAASNLTWPDYSNGG